MALGDEFIGSRALDSEMDMRRASGIFHRPNGSKPILARRGRFESTVALKVAVAPGGVLTAAVDIRPIGIRLPDLHDGTPNRISMRIQNTTAELRHAAHSG